MARFTEQTVERRNSHRCVCNVQCTFETQGFLRDLSIGGAAIDLPFALPRGHKLRIRISDDDPRLRIVDAEVLSTRALSSSFIVHMRFVGASPGLEKALQKHLFVLASQRLL